MKHFIAVIICALSAISLSAQVGGNGAYRFLDLVYSGRIAALGGSWTSDPSGDINVGMWNPALLDSTTHNHLAVNYVNYLSDINYTNFAYGFSVDEKSSIGLGFKYVGYGTFIRADENGNQMGEFTAADYMLQGGYGYKFNDFIRLGASLKLLYSAYEQYSSVGLATDLAATYRNEEERLTMTLIAKNIGFQLTPFGDERENLPFRLDYSISGKLKYMPLRWHFTWENLQKFDLSYTDPNLPTSDPLTGDPIDNSIGFGGKVLRHISLGAELFTEKNFNLRAGYNFRRQAELGLEDIRSGSGFSFGFGIRVKKIRFDYARTAYHFAGASHHFSVSTDLNELFNY